MPKPGSDVKIMSRSSGDRTILVVNDRPVQMKELLKVRLSSHQFKNVYWKFKQNITEQIRF